MSVTVHGDHGTTAATQFTATPGQVAFTPDGTRLLVTTKGATNDVDVFSVRADGSVTVPGGAGGEGIAAA